jgi:hypothetical protein
MSEFFSFIKKDLSEASETLTKKFQELANSAGWDPSAANAVSVRNGNDFNIEKSMQQQVEDIEYGSLGKPALAVMRSLQAEMDQTVIKILGKAASDYANKLAPGVFQK